MPPPRKKKKPSSSSPSPFQEGYGQGFLYTAGAGMIGFALLGLMARRSTGWL